MSNSREVLSIKIKVNSFITDTIVVREEDEPYILAKNFCMKYNLNKKALLAITKMIDRNLDLIINEEIKKKINNDAPKITHTRKYSQQIQIKKPIKLIPNHTSHKSLQLDSIITENLQTEKALSPRLADFNYHDTRKFSELLQGNKTLKLIPTHHSHKSLQFDNIITDNLQTEKIHSPKSVNFNFHDTGINNKKEVYDNTKLLNKVPKSILKKSSTQGHFSSLIGNSSNIYKLNSRDISKRQVNIFKK